MLCLPAAPDNHHLLLSLADQSANAAADDALSGRGGRRNSLGLTHVDSQELLAALLDKGYSLAGATPERVDSVSPDTAAGPGLLATDSKVLIKIPRSAALPK